MQVQDHGQVQPPLARPDITDIACPLLVGRISVEVTIQQVWRDIELMIAVPLSADCAAIACRAMVAALYLRVLTTNMPF